MAGRKQPTFKKLQKEQQRKERQEEKFAKRMLRKQQPPPAESPDQDENVLPAEPVNASPLN